MSQEEIILGKIKGLLPDRKKFEERIVEYIKSEYFPLIYQCLYERIMPPNSKRFSTEDYKRLLRENNYLKLLNDIYRTRLSGRAFDIILDRLDEKVEDFNNYKAVLEQFKKCNPREDKIVNAFSLGTKVLHTYNPEENPILDSVVRNNLGINYQMDIDLCLDFKNAMNNFANSHKEYFSLDNSSTVKTEFKRFKLKIEFPKMKLLDMAILGSGL